MTRVMVSPRLYWATLRDLKPVQIYGRVWRRLHQSRLRDAPPPECRKRRGTWVSPAMREPSLLGSDTFCFLSETRTLGDWGWDSPSVARLWRYNLHYFDDLNADSAADRSSWHHGLIRRWISDNPVGIGTGWEPYPMSLRIVNWVKWILARNIPSEAMIESLAVQARSLASQMEWHLLGNHLLANAKAMVFAGCMFEGPEAESWLNLGTRVLTREIGEQVLTDGGHFELSPMYHAIVLEDLLDVLNCVRAFPDAPLRPSHCLDVLPDVIDRMRRWLAVMCHPDGEISFFNDAAFGVTPCPKSLQNYAEVLGLGTQPVVSGGVVHLAASGYVRVSIGDCIAILDVGRVGPHHLPAHAHADTLSFELSIRGRRVLVNSGTSLYAAGQRRQSQRATRAHNTVSVDGRDSSEVWSSFRVGRKAVPLQVTINDAPDCIEIACAHDGYRRLRQPVTHARSWKFRPRLLSVVDAVGDAGRAVSHWHWHPECRVIPTTPCGSGLESFEATLGLPGAVVSFQAKDVTGEVLEGTWHPRFGVTVPATMFDCRFHRAESEAEIRWA